MLLYEHRRNWIGRCDDLETVIQVFKQEDRKGWTVVDFREKFQLEKEKKHLQLCEHWKAQALTNFSCEALDLETARRELDDLSGSEGKARMRSGELSLVWVLFFVGIFWGDYGLLHVKGDQASDFLDAKEAQVISIANLSIINEESTCDLVASCSTNCTRGVCLPLLSDVLSCTYTAVNTDCIKDNISQPVQYCSDIQVNFLRSYVRTPHGIFQGNGDEVPFEMQNSVCSQRQLDPLFKDLHKLQNASLYYFNFYFGAVDGTFRFYPGTEAKDCYNFDPRIRPWYVGAISVLKDLVVLLDSGYTMGNNLGVATLEITRLAAAQNVTGQILKTLAPNDRATVITFNTSAEANIISPSYLVPDDGLNLTDPGFQHLLDSVNSATTSNSAVSGVNFTAGLNLAISTLNQSSPSGALKIVILLTDGVSESSTEELVSVVQQFQAQLIRLFIYEIGGSSSPSLGQLACQVEGFAEQLNPLNLIQNPLYSVNSYFSFLARSQRETNDTPFWQPAYKDYDNLGSVITVAYPAMSMDGSRLIGVAGIDVQTDGLTLTFRNLLDSDLMSSRRVDISTNRFGPNISDCNPVYNDSLGQCSASSTLLNPFCTKDDFKSTYEGLVCCPDCGISSASGSNNTIMIVIVVSAVAVLAALVLSVFLWFRFCKPRPRPSDYGEFVKIPKFSYQTLSLATDNFGEQNKLGVGTFGTVYLGTLDDGTKVAVKKLFYQPSNGLRDFESEIRVLATANHNNLVALKGFCLEQHHILVYEYVENSDLDNWLFVKPVNDNMILPWKKRVVIARGVAKGLAYLHEELQNRQKVCHSDIKPANILLDTDFNPKVADMGMAKLYQGGSEMAATGGTLGYIAPEIHHGAAATTRTDVYSYGMVLLEMVTGRRFSERNLPLWTAMHVAEKKEIEVLDPVLGELRDDDEAKAKRLICIALLCTSKYPETRPDMSAVVKMIEGFQPVPSLPFSLDDENMADLTDTFTTDSSTVVLTGSKSDRIPPSGAKTWTFSDAIKKLKIRTGKSSPPRSKEQSQSTTTEYPKTRSKERSQSKTTEYPKTRSKERSQSKTTEYSKTRSKERPPTWSTDLPPNRSILPD